MAREEVFGMRNPCAATIATTSGEVRLPGMPPMECLSTTIGLSQTSRWPTSTMACVRASVSSAVMKLAQAIRKAATSMSE